MAGHKKGKKRAERRGRGAAGERDAAEEAEASNMVQ